MTDEIETMVGTTHIVVNGRFPVDPDSLDAATEGILNMQAASRAEEGCFDYTFSVELGDPGMLLITERWASVEALQAHFATPHMADFRHVMGALNIAGGSVHFLEATEIERPA